MKRALNGVLGVMLGAVLVRAPLQLSCLTSD